jgi:hypothetical protein
MAEEKDTSQIETNAIAQEIETIKVLANNQRKQFSRHWYDNNFFDDGHHFRFISRTTGRIVDLSDRATLYTPQRAIPKASRQIRGMANLMLSSDFIPIIKPEMVSPYTYGKDQQAFQNAWEQAKTIAKRTGQWMEEEWKDQDMDIKLSLMTLLTMKNGISFMQVWADPVSEAIKTQVYDAFDIYLQANVTEIEDSPFIGKVIPKTIKEIKANENFDEDQLAKISPDNRYASDEIKEAYLASKYGQEGKPSDSSATLLLNEFFFKEYLNEDNKARIKDQDNGSDILKDKEIGDPVYRHIFTAGKVWLYDQYEDIPCYPFVDFRLEPGPIYQVAQIERFIPANKSLDSVMSRLERFVHTMNVGVWLKQKDENFKLNNVSGGLVAEYTSVPPQQMQNATMPPSTFQLINLLSSFIEEQGVTTSALGKLPSGVKAWGAIESLKASEFANLYIPIKQLKKAIQKISERMIDIADKHFISPKMVYRMDKGNPDYFEVMGSGAMSNRKKAKINTPEGIIPIKKDYKVEIEVESGLGYTEEGKKGRMMELANWMLELAKVGMITPQAVKVVIERLLEIFKFGNTSQMMEALDTMQMPQDKEFSPDQQQQIKVAMLEVIKDLQQAQQPMEEPQAQPGMMTQGGV